MDALLLPLALTLIAAEVGGYVSDRLKLTRVAGQIAAGLVIGPSLLGLVHVDGQLEMLAGFGAICVLAIAGLETDIPGIRAVGKPALLAAIGGVILPLVFGFVVAHAFGYNDRAALFCGAILTATSVGISAATLRELGLGRSRTGSTILGAAIIDDVLGLIVLALVVADTGSSGSQPILQIGAMVAVLAGAAVFLWLFRSRFANLLHHLHVQGGGIAGLVGVVLVVAWVFQTLGGLAAITGAYVAGLAVAGTHVADGLREKLVHTGEAFLVPVFLVAIGLSVDLRAAPALLPAMLALFAVGVIGKVVGCGIGARMGGLDSHASLGVGMGMIARGEVALVAATLARTSGAIDAGLYSAVILVALGTTVITPILLSIWAHRPSLSGIVLEGFQPGAAGGPMSVGVPVMQMIDPE